MEKTKTKKVRERKLYKGDTILAKSFLNQMNIVAPVQFVTTRVPYVQDSYSSFGGVTVPDKVLLLSGQPYYTGVKAIYLTGMEYNTKTKTYLPRVRWVIPQDFEVRVLTGRMGNEMRGAYETYVKTNLAAELGHSFTVGSDPEIFVENAEGVIPAFRFLKDKAHADHTSAGKPVYWDGFQAEFETEAGDCLAYHVDSIREGLKAVYDRSRVFDPKAELSIRTVVEVSEETLQSASPEHVGFGCMPSRNVYGLHGETCPPRELPVRFSGGHIHFGIGKQTDEAKVEGIVKALDAVLGVACVSLFAKFDNPVRRRFYGLPGEHRLPPHGLEYRVLSNAWLSHPLITHLVFDLSRKALVLGAKGLLRLWDGSEEETVSCIRNCDVEKARAILERNKAILIQMFEACYPNKETAARAYQIFLEGMESVVEEPGNLTKNWDLNRTWRYHGAGVMEKNVKNLMPMILNGKKV